MSITPARLLIVRCCALAAMGLAAAAPPLRAGAPGEGTAESGERPMPETPPPGEIRFRGKNTLHGVDGFFNRWCIREAKIDREKPGRSLLEIEIEVASLETDDDERDVNLRSEEFFNVEEFPRARITINSVCPLPDKKPADSWYKARIEIVLRGVTREQDVEFEILDTDPLEVSGNTEIRRSDFGVGKPYKWYNPMSIKDVIPVTFRLEIDPSNISPAADGDAVSLQGTGSESHPE